MSESSTAGGISVRLSTQQWNAVLSLLQEVAAPLRITAPLVQAIQAQCMAANHADTDGKVPA